MLKASIHNTLDALIKVQGQKNPIAVAFSGGGDSTALLSLTSKWLSGKTPLYALIVDHGLRAGSALEAQKAAKVAQGLGALPHVLTWQGQKPKAGIQEKARMARYHMMGAKCRSLGVENLLLGHNKDDQAETVFMRGQKKSGWRGLAGMRPSSRAPIWPELYRVNVVRPMLDVSRAQLRAYNDENELAYIDDPSNENQDFTRIKARTFLKPRPALRTELGSIAQDAARGLSAERAHISALIKTQTNIHSWGGVRLHKQAITGNGDLGNELLRCLSLAVSGQGQAPAREKFGKLRSSILSAKFSGATLGGVQFIPNKTSVLMTRDPGHVLGRSGKGALGAQRLVAGEDFIWDGRFRLQTAEDGVSAAPLFGYLEQLTKQQKQAMKMVPVSARATLPAMVRAGTLVSSLFHNKSAQFQFENLTGARLQSLSD